MQSDAYAESCLRPYRFLSVTFLYGPPIWHMLLWCEPIGHILLFRRTLTWRRLSSDGQTVDAQVGTDAVDDQKSPTEVGYHGEDEVCS